jgi:2-methylcitrate dehydratase
MIRDLDFNDTYPGGHPSDGIGALLAVAGAIGASGQEFLTSVVIAYEIFIRLQMAGKLREKGWDNGFGIGVGVAAGTARLLGLDRKQLRHAIALTATANVPLRATRAGMLSMWKGAATAFSTEAAVRATHLAAEGMTGPEAPFTGRHGLTELITGPLDVPAFPHVGGEFYIPRAKIKYWPVVYNMQAMVWSAIELRRLLGDASLASARVETYWSAWHESGSEPAKWDPKTRETADHSLPYIFAWTLRHGSIGPEAFTDDAFTDPGLRPVMNAVTVVIDDEFEALYPDTVRMRVRATDDAGSDHIVEVENPLGHEKNPVSDTEIEEKFTRLAEHHLGTAQVPGVLERWWALEQHTVAEALDLVAPLHANGDVDDVTHF